MLEFRGHHTYLLLFFKEMKEQIKDEGRYRIHLQQHHGPVDPEEVYQLRSHWKYRDRLRIKLIIVVFCALLLS